MKMPMKPVRRSLNFAERRRILLSKPPINIQLFKKSNRLNEAQVKQLKSQGINLTVNHTERDALRLLRTRK